MHRNPFCKYSSVLCTKLEGDCKGRDPLVKVGSEDIFSGGFFLLPASGARGNRPEVVVQALLLFLGATPELSHNLLRSIGEQQRTACVRGSVSELLFSEYGICVRPTSPRGWDEPDIHAVRDPDVGRMLLDYQPKSTAAW